MIIEDILQALANSGLGYFMNTTRGAFAFVETIHVIALSIVFGTILVVDLRLLGVASTNRPFTAVANELLKWTWGAFVVAAITGALMFATNPSFYFFGTEFRVKMLLLVLAGVNMAIFEFKTIKSVRDWDVAVASPTAARVAGGLSLLLWTSVIIMGRMIGFAAASVDPFAALG